VEESQAFEGTAFIAGQQLSVLVELRWSGLSDGTAFLLIPDLSLEARGTATIRNDRLNMDLRYEGVCSGEAQVEAALDGGGQKASGTLEAKDCTGKESGTIVLTKRSGEAIPASR
jgi:hypothetical protein